MNRNLTLYLHKRLLAIVLSLALIILVISTTFTMLAEMNSFVKLITTKLSITTLYIIMFVTTIGSIIFAIKLESYINSSESEEQLAKYNLIQQDIEFYNSELSEEIINSTFCINVRNYCTIKWNQGDSKNFFKYSKLYCDVMCFIYLTKDSNRVVSWREEIDCMNKMILLMEECCYISQNRVDLFEMSTNYRFPIGLFVLPLFNAIEYAIKVKHNELEIACFKISGFWNCKIGNQFNLFDSSYEDSEFIGISELKKRLNTGNWPIELDYKKCSHGAGVLISGSYAIQ